MLSFYVCVTLACLSVYGWYPWMSEDGSGFFRTGCELPCECCELNPCPLEEHYELLTTEPMLQVEQTLPSTNTK